MSVPRAERVYLDLVRDYQTPILNYIWRRVGDRFTAEDLTQETFTKAWRALDRLELEDAAAPRRRGWLYRIAHNIVADHHRRRARIRWLTLDAVRGIGESDPSAPTAERDAVSRVLRHLTDDHREVLLLFNHAGLQADEVGQVLGITPAAARKRRQRAREAFEVAWHQAMEPADALRGEPGGRPDDDEGSSEGPDDGPPEGPGGPAGASDGGEGTDGSAGATERASDAPGSVRSDASAAPVRSGRFGPGGGRPMNTEREGTPTVGGNGPLRDHEGAGGDGPTGGGFGSVPPSDDRWERRIQRALGEKIIRPSDALHRSLLAVPRRERRRGWLAVFAVAAPAMACALVSVGLWSGWLPGGPLGEGDGAGRVIRSERATDTAADARETDSGDPERASRADGATVTTTQSALARGVLSTPTPGILSAATTPPLAATAGRGSPAPAGRTGARGPGRDAATTGPVDPSQPETPAPGGDDEEGDTRRIGPQVGTETPRAATATPPGDADLPPPSTETAAPRPTATRGIEDPAPPTPTPPAEPPGIPPGPTDPPNPTATPAGTSAPPGGPGPGPGPSATIAGTATSTVVPTRERGIVATRTVTATATVTPTATSTMTPTPSGGAGVGRTQDRVERIAACGGGRAGRIEPSGPSSDALVHDGCPHRPGAPLVQSGRPRIAVRALGRPTVLDGSRAATGPPGRGPGSVLPSVRSR